jgi:hypothetical protein
LTYGDSFSKIFAHAAEHKTNPILSAEIEIKGYSYYRQRKQEKNETGCFAAACRRALRESISPVGAFIAAGGGL